MRPNDAAAIACAQAAAIDPRSLIAEPLGTMPRRRARIVAGTADDDSAVVRVDVSLSRRIGHGRCLWLAPRSRNRPTAEDRPGALLTLRGEPSKDR